jgi:hypothetical protein
MAQSTKKSANKSRPKRDAGHQVRATSAAEVGETQAREAGADFQWHYGRVTRLGHFAPVGGREVVVLWDEGGVTSQQGNLSDEQWEILTLAFMTTGRIAILSDQVGESWTADFRFLEAVR